MKRKKKKKKSKIKMKRKVKSSIDDLDNVYTMRN